MTLGFCEWQCCKSNLIRGYSSNISWLIVIAFTRILTHCLSNHSFNVFAVILYIWRPSPLILDPRTRYMSWWLGSQTMLSLLDSTSNERNQDEPSQSCLLSFPQNIHACCKLIPLHSNLQSYFKRNLHELLKPKVPAVL